MTRRHRLCAGAAAALLMAVALPACAAPSPFVHAKGDRLMQGRHPFIVRGAALMDDAALWAKDAVVFAPDAIEERDWAFTAVGEINTVRLALKMDAFIDATGAPRQSGFDFLDRQLALAGKFRLLVPLDMHIPPGGATQDYHPGKENGGFWKDPTLQERFVAGWKLIAERYRTDQRILGYELMNEPAITAASYWALMEKTIAAIRAVDANHLLVLQPAIDFQFPEIADPNIAFSIHFYKPLGLTHQNVFWLPEFRSSSPIAYPGGAIDAHGGTAGYYDRAILRGAMAAVTRQAKGQGRPLLLGEFGVSTCADEESASRWVSDVVDIVRELHLAGYLFWRQIDPRGDDPAKPGACRMAMINHGGFFSPAQFFGLRPAFARKQKDFDGRSFYMNYSPVHPVPR